MKIKVTDKILSIHPYLSTDWEYVSYLHVREGALIIALTDASLVSIQGLQSGEIEQIFAAHLHFLEHKKSSGEFHSKNIFTQLFSGETQGPQFKFFAGMQDLLIQAIQHNPSHAELPLLPPEVVNKIAMLRAMVSPEEVLALPPAEMNCNCLYCQINRILRKEVLHGDSFPDHPTLDTSEVIKDQDLQFEQWEIVQTATNMYEVTDKLDRNAHYSVFLGDPIGCTCGKANCEHIVAVLRS